MDSGAGSLRQALADAAAAPGADTLIFSQSLSGGTISLTTSASGTALTVNDADAVTIDASALTNGLTLTKPAGSYRLFRVSGGVCALDSLTLTGGNSMDGGALLNFGNTTLTRCTLSGNTGTSSGGAVANQGPLTLDRCTVSGNTGIVGGGLYNLFGFTATVVNSTFTGNSATHIGGAILNEGTLTLRHATIAENSAANGGGGIFNALGTLLLGNSIVAGNFVGATRNDLRGDGSSTFTTQGGNLIGVNGPLVVEFPPGLPNANGDFAGSDTAPIDPRLLPLGKYNGPTPTMPPLAGSRAIDGGINFGLDTIDQRGLSRFADGDNNGLARPDSGAVEAAFRFVTDNGNSGPGTLRQALADAAAVPGWEAIAFSQTLNGGTISLTTSADTGGTGPSGIAVTDDDGVAIDATRLSAGLTIAKPAGQYRLFQVDFGKRLSLHQLTLTGGDSPSGPGGAILNAGGALSVSDCTFTANVATAGGAIFAESGPLGNGRSTDIRRCTFTGNQATTTRGGAIIGSFGKTSVLSCTISGNSAPAATGGGIAGNGTANASVTVVASSIVSGNPGGDVQFGFGSTNTFSSQGRNLIGTGNAIGAFTQTGDVINNLDPLLAPLDHYGGPTRTMALRPGSLARNTASGSAAAFDQRGFAIFGMPDKGAYESGTLTNYNAFIWETLPATATIAEHAAAFDFDADGASNGDEYIAGTTVTNPLSLLRVTSFTRSGTMYSFTFPSVPGRNYVTEYSSDFITWTPGLPTGAGTGGPLTFTFFADPITFPRLFLRLRVGP